MLIRDPRATKLARVARGHVRLGSLSIPIWLITALLFVAGVTIGLQFIASSYDVRGPIERIAKDFSGLPGSAETYFAALAIALIGFTPRVRWISVGAMVVIQAGFVLGRWLRHDEFALGDGPLYVMIGLLAWSLFGLSGDARARALKPLGVGLLLGFATKIADSWLIVSTRARPRVLDEYVMVADEALGQPSWRVGQVLDALGPVPSAILHAVYIGLPLGAIAVALWQLRHVARGSSIWPSHHIIRSFLVVGMLGPLIYFLFPVVGPIFAYGDASHGYQIADIWPGQLPLIPATPDWLDFDSATARNCMPSLHTAWATLIFIHTRRSPRPLRYAGTFWLVATLLATLGFGYHYGVDLIAGATLSLTIDSALRDPRRGWGSWRIQLVGYGSALFAALLLSYRYMPLQFAGHPWVFGPVLLAALGLLIAMFYREFFAGHRSELATGGIDAETTNPAPGPAPTPEQTPARGSSEPEDDLNLSSER
ncbi:phosphatase PAP2 family protein [Gordonia sp. ABSL1-1]|uniref:phosphatase PAP2 family protein n=1 Tax=Gordonia sp. ABSL1-1 TaxID=3053923 RepID=UPI00257309BB|nr:phosphatase PAP2 family protein [Gordonia sp. ABSL1-1]MDL9938045.1 phosphatase PAP2 family protein [Gordonia sp. ABSL1-1]